MYFPFFFFFFFFFSYGGYDGYHVYNDVAVLDTRTWTWTVKNTNAAVQGRADVSIICHVEFIYFLKKKKKSVYIYKSVFFFILFLFVVLV
jgi:hypothetical protein